MSPTHDQQSTVGTDAAPRLEVVAAPDASGLTPERFGTPDGSVRPPTGEPTPSGSPGIGGRLPAALSPVLLLVAGALSAGVLVAAGVFSVTGALCLTALTYTVAIFAVGLVVEGRRRAVDRVVTSLVTIAFVLAMAPLLSLVWTAASQGAARFDVAFFTQTMAGVVGEGGGAAHAIVGTLQVTGLAALVSVPVGVMAAVWLVEYGKGPLKKAITFLVDVMTGIPSIVAGLFAFALFATVLGDPGHRSGWAGAIALSVLMTPVVIRSCEEMLKLVPDELREASFALGVPRWRTIAKVVLPTSIGGIVAGVTIAIARVIGETAPLLVTMGATVGFNFDMTGGRVATLPVYAYDQFIRRGLPPEAFVERAWTAALVLILIVMALNAVGRLVAFVFAPTTNR